MTVASADWVSGKGRTVSELITLKRIKPGTVLDLGGGNQVLVGHVNNLMGVCDDCRDFDPNKTVVQRLRQIAWKQD
jgi:hypothetical protein